MRAFYKIIFSALFMIILFGWLGYGHYQGEVKRKAFCEQQCETKKALGFRGKVLKKTLEGPYHKGKATWHILQGKKDTLSYYNSWIPLAGIVKKGDSLEKYPGEWVIYHYRDNRLLERAVCQCDDCEALCEKSYRNCLD